MAPDRPTDHDRVDDAALADRIRATATAVAERTAAPARDLDTPSPIVLPDHHRSPARLVGVAAACLLVVALVAGAVVALRDRPGEVTTDGTPSGPGSGGLPRLLPTWVPEGYALTETKVTPGPPPKASFLRRYEWVTPGCGDDPASLCPYGPGAAGPSAPGPGAPGPSRVDVRVTAVDDPQGLAGPETNPPVAQPVDVNGDAGWVNVTMDGISSSADDRGYTVTWDHGAVRVSVTSRGASNEDTVRIARGVTVGGTPTSPTADVAADALPGTLRSTYAGPDLLLAMGALPGRVGMARLVYTNGRQTPYVEGSPPARMEGVATDQIFLTEYDAPIGAASPWWLPLTGRSEPVTVDAITCVTTIGLGGPLPPASGPLPWTSVLCAGATTFVALGSSSIPRADIERMAHSLRPSTGAPTPQPDPTPGPTPTASTTAPGVTLPDASVPPGSTTSPSTSHVEVDTKVLHDRALGDRVDLWVFEPVSAASRAGEASGCECWRRLYQAVAVTSTGSTTSTGGIDLTEVHLRVAPEATLWIASASVGGRWMAATPSTGELVICDDQSCPSRPRFVPPAEITDPTLRDALAKPRVRVSDGRGDHGWMDTADLIPQVPASVPPGWSPPPAMHPVYATETGDEIVGYMVDGVGFVDRARAEASDLDPARLQRELAGPESPRVGP